VRRTTYLEAGLRLGVAGAGSIARKSKVHGENRLWLGPGTVVQYNGAASSWEEP
jgi:hypothetical protein